jgi:uncharacterized protein (DUF433 family)
MNIMQQLSGITFNPEVMGGKPGIRELRVAIGTVVGLMSAGHSQEKILQSYPHLELENIYEALAYAAWRSEETEWEAAKNRFERQLLGEVDS